MRLYWIVTWRLSSFFVLVRYYSSRQLEKYYRFTVRDLCQSVSPVSSPCDFVLSETYVVDVDTVTFASHKHKVWRGRSHDRRDANPSSVCCETQICASVWIPTTWFSPQNFVRVCGAAVSHFGSPWLRGFGIRAFKHWSEVIQSSICVISNWTLITTFPSDLSSKFFL